MLRNDTHHIGEALEMPAFKRIGARHDMTGTGPRRDVASCGRNRVKSAGITYKLTLTESTRSSSACNARRPTPRVFDRPSASAAR